MMQLAYISSTAIAEVPPNDPRSNVISEDLLRVATVDSRPIYGNSTFPVFVSVFHMAADVFEFIDRRRIHTLTANCTLGIRVSGANSTFIETSALWLNYTFPIERNTFRKLTGVDSLLFM